jgi:2-desacetyl-2-hydroxyethyl bacteriochlorophyllide A dehydrogenase
MESSKQLWFLGPQAVEARAVSCPEPDADSVRVRTHCSALSAGTEMLVYRGELPEDLALDALLDDMQEPPTYPLQYGYASVGTVDAIGANIAQDYLGKRVFAFAPHASHFLCDPAGLIAIPDAVSFEDAAFLANMETAVNLVQDAQVLIGERIVVLGQGVVGLLVTGLLARFPLSKLVCVDGIEARRELALRLGASEVFPQAKVQAIAAAVGEQGADLIFELSGAPQALNLAIDLSGYGSRIIIGSWYGSKSAAIALGGKAHRNRLHISTSQVSTIAPGLSARWNKARRFDVAWQMLAALKPSQWVSNRCHIDEAPALYKQLHQAPESITQALFTYE